MSVIKESMQYTCFGEMFYQIASTACDPSPFDSTFQLYEFFKTQHANFKFECQWTQGNIYTALARNLFGREFSLELTRQLLRDGIAGAAKADKYGFTAKAYATACRHTALVELLSAYDGSPIERLPNAVITAPSLQLVQGSNMGQAIDKAQDAKSELCYPMELFNSTDAAQALSCAIPDSHHQKSLVALTESNPRRHSQPLKNIHIERCRELKIKFPNFSEVVKQVESAARLEMMGDAPELRMDPILLLGPPGIGKTQFCKELAKIFDLPNLRIDCGLNTDRKQIYSGYAPSFQAAAPSLIAQQMLSCDFANPLFMLDEIEKSPSGGTEDGFAALFSLLERSTNDSIKDDYFGTTFNYSRVNWIATANNIDFIPEAIQTRLNVFDVPAPDREQTMTIAQFMYESMLNDPASRWAHSFSPELPDEVLEGLAHLSPRKLKRRFKEIIQAAAMRSIESPTSGLIQITEADLPEDLIESTGPTIGFAAS